MVNFMEVQNLNCSIMEVDEYFPTVLLASYLKGIWDVLYDMRRPKSAIDVFSSYL